TIETTLGENEITIDFGSGTNTIKQVHVSATVTDVFGLHSKFEYFTSSHCIGGTDPAQLKGALLKESENITQTKITSETIREVGKSPARLGMIYMSASFAARDGRVTPDELERLEKITLSANK